MVTHHGVINDSCSISVTLVIERVDKSSLQQMAGSDIRLLWQAVSSAVYAG